MPDRRADRAEYLSELSQAYRATFLHPNTPDLLPLAGIVLGDLRRVCCVDRPSTRTDREGRVDPLAVMFNEGKRFVFLRIQQCIALEPARLQRMIDQAAATDV
jgi:hypothetical protein